MFSEAIKAALIGAGVTAVLSAVLNAIALAYFLGGLRKTVDGHSRLLELLPCLKPRCPSLVEEK
jgi:hypothetical protein